MVFIVFEPTKLKIKLVTLSPRNFNPWILPTLQYENVRLEQALVYFCFKFDQTVCFPNRAVEESLAANQENMSRLGLPKTSLFVDPKNPHERKREGTTPVGLKNIGNTCWFSAVVQVTEMISISHCETDFFFCINWYHHPLLVSAAHPRVLWEGVQLHSSPSLQWGHSAPTQCDLLVGATETVCSPTPLS